MGGGRNHKKVSVVPDWTVNECEVTVHRKVVHGASASPAHSIRRGRLSREAAESEGAASKLTRECLRPRPLRRKFCSPRLPPRRKAQLLPPQAPERSARGVRKIGSRWFAQMASASDAASCHTTWRSRQPSGTATRAPSTRRSNPTIQATAAPGRRARQQKPAGRISNAGLTWAVQECTRRSRPRPPRPTSRSTSSSAQP